MGEFAGIVRKGFLAACNGFIGLIVIHPFIDLL
jgi:hypothetical protein